MALHKKITIGVRVGKERLSLVLWTSPTMALNKHSRSQLHFWVIVNSSLTWTS